MNRLPARTAAARPPSPVHSGAGIAAFVIALVVMLLAMLAAPFGLFLQFLPRLFNLTTTGNDLALRVTFVFVAVDLIAAGLAIAALREPGHSRVFPMIALVIAGLTLLAIGVLVGLAALVLRG